MADTVRVCGSPLGWGYLPVLRSGDHAAFLAWSETAEVDRLIDRTADRVTPETVVDRAALRGVLADTRERGYGISIREYDLGQSGVSAPVFDDAGRVTMALCSLAFSSELNESTVADAGTLIRASGLRITSASRHRSHR